MQPTTIRSVITVIGLLGALSAPGAAQKSDQKHVTQVDLPEVIWRDPGDMHSLNLLTGAGGEQDAPDPNGTYTFVEESRDGTNPKFEVKDQAGTRWRVKLGQETRSETASSRLLWAAGYLVDEDYYLETLKVVGLPRLQRGQELVSAGGIIHGAGLERHLKGVKKTGSWDWFDNAFRGTRELNGLRVMMALLNNWDLKDVNNSIDETETERRYLVSDLGATLGNSGNYFTRSKSSLASYQVTTFIDHTDADSVTFVMHTRPFALSAVRINYYRDNARMEGVARRIPRADAKWLGQRLAQLSAAQLRDCFRGAGYPPNEVEGYTNMIAKRIADLNALEVS